jgi:hypothetical protein
MKKAVMTPAGQARQELLTLLCDLLLVATTLVALGLGLVWFMSPLALGFAGSEQLVDPDRRQWAGTLYRLSYAFGIPMLLLAQVVAIALRVRRSRLWAMAVSMLAIAAFTLCAAAALKLRG